MEAVDKIERVLGLYTKLISGAVVNKAEEATNYNVNERSIQRDIDDRFSRLHHAKQMAKGCFLQRIF